VCVCVSRTPEVLGYIKVLLIKFNTAKNKKKRNEGHGIADKLNTSCEQVLTTASYLFSSKKLWEGNVLSRITRKDTFGYHEPCQLILHLVKHDHGRLISN
jgi:hypothetical protein